MALPVESETVLLTVGRLPVALELARLFRAMHWRVVVAEPTAWHVARLSNRVARSFKVPSPVHDRDGWEARIAQIVDAESVTLIVPVSEENLFVAALAARLPRSVRVLSMPADCLLSLHDKWRFALRAQRLNLSVPETIRCDDDGVDAFTKRYAVVRKPRFSCSGVGLSRLERGRVLPVGQRVASHVLQVCVDGAACCSFAIAARGRVEALVVYRPLTEAGSVAVCFEAVEPPPSVVDVVTAIVADTAFTGMIAFDHLWSPHRGWQVIECNPRATSGLHLMSGDVVRSAITKAMEAVVETGEVSEVGSRGETMAAIEALVPLGARAQEFWSHLAELQGRILRGRWQWMPWKHLLTSRDISWHRSDRKPFLFFVPVNLALMVKAWRAGLAIPQIVMQDLAWRPARADDTLFEAGTLPENAE